MVSTKIPQVILLFILCASKCVFERNGLAQAQQGFRPFFSTNLGEERQIVICAVFMVIYILKIDDDIDYLNIFFRLYCWHIIATYAKGFSPMTLRVVKIQLNPAWAHIRALYWLLWSERSGTPLTV